MKTLINLTGLIMLSGAMLAQTTVSGPLFSNTQWHASGNPYQVIGNVQLPPGVTLTIDPGVVINFTGEYEILVKGAITAQGTATLPIKITAPYSQYQPIFMFREANLSNSKLSYLEIIGNDKIAVQVGEIGDNIQPSGILKLSNFDVTGAKIQTLGHNSSASVEIENSKFSGTYIYSSNATFSEPISINNCTFSALSQIGTGSSQGTVAITDCKIQGSKLYANFGLMDLKNCKIDFSQFGQGVGAVVNITDCELNSTSVLMNNVVNFSNCVINTGSTFGIKCMGGLVECTRLTGNGQQIGFEFGDGGPVIYKSTITSCSVGIWARKVNSFVCDSVNIFNNTTYNIMTSYPYSSISMVDVYWGSNDSATIASKIYDYYDDINFAKCYFPTPLNEQRQFSSCAVTLTVSTTATGISEFVRSERIFVYPNPTGSHINLSFHRPLQGTIEIMNTEYRIMRRLYVNEPEVSLDVADLPTGLYLVKFQGSEFNAICKFLKE